MLLGDDRLTNDTLALAGQLRNRGTLRADGVTLEGATSLVNAATVEQIGAVTLGASPSDAATIRNLAGATWDLADATEISQTGAASSFVNLGLMQQGAGDHSTISANFYNRGTLDVEGSLDFTGAIVRLLGTVEGAGQINADFAAFVSTSVSSAGFTATRARLIGDVSFASTNVNATDFTLADATVNFSGTYTLGFGAVVGSGEIDFHGTGAVSALYFDGAVSLMNAGALTFATSNDVVMAGGGTVEYRNLAGATWQTNARSSTDYTAQAGTNGLFDNAGSYTENGHGVFDIAFNNDGQFFEGIYATHPNAQSNDLIYLLGDATFNKAITGTGAITVDTHVTTNAAVSAGQTFDFIHGGFFGSPVLTIGDFADFNGVIADFQTDGDSAIDLVGHAWTFQNAALNADGSGVTLMFSDNGQQKGLDFVGQYDPSKFTVSSPSGELVIGYNART